MKSFWVGCFAGAYALGAILTFLFVGSLVVLGGNAADMWKPVVYALLWPVALPLFLMGKA